MKTVFIEQFASNEFDNSIGAKIAVTSGFIQSVQTLNELVRDNDLTKAARFGLVDVDFADDDEDQPDFWELVCDDTQFWIDAIVKHTDIRISTAPIELKALRQLFEETPDKETVQR